MNHMSIKEKIDESFEILTRLNPNSSVYSGADRKDYKLKKVLVANRGEIAKRFFLALHEEGIPSVAVVTDPDRGQSWYEFADEVVFIGESSNYSNMYIVIAAVLFSSANAIYSGYGFLSENSHFVEAIDSVSEIIKRKIIFMGPSHSSMKMMGNKISGRALAEENSIPLFKSSEQFSPDEKEKAKKAALQIGYPVLIKLSSGGGGKGMYPVFSEKEMDSAIDSSARIGMDLYRDASFYLEKFIERPVHIEVQIFNGSAIGIRKCAVQRRNQKIIEESGLSFLSNEHAIEMLAAAEKVALASGYDGGGAGTVEFLIDSKTGKFGFMEMNTRLQVEYAVTDQALDIDIAKWQILYYDGRADEMRGLIPLKDRMSEKNHSIECRIYAEDPENDYMPSPGIINEMDLPTFNGIRCDFGFGDGDHVLPMYDPMIGKLISYGSTRAEAIIRLERALQELYINGVKTNVKQLLRIVRHPEFINGDYTNNILDDHSWLSLREGSQAEITEEERILPQLFGAFSEYIRYMQITIREYLAVLNLESVVDTADIRKPASTYIVDFRGVKNLVDFVQYSVDSFYCYLDGEYAGGIEVISMNDRSDDILLLFGSSVYRIRVNRFSGQLEVRMKAALNKIDYFRMIIYPEGKDLSDFKRDLLSPFQGTFVAFSSNLKTGDSIKQGDPILILSSMKMETVIQSPVSGKISYIIEDGDISRLQIGKTADGRIIGKSIQAGELLAVIVPEGGKIEKTENPQIRLKAQASQTQADDIKSVLLKNNSDYPFFYSIENSTEVIRLLLASLKGFMVKPVVFENLLKYMDGINAASFNQIPDSIFNLIEQYIKHYANIKKMFSASAGRRGLSFQEELYLYISNRGKHGIGVTADFDMLVTEILNSYNLSRPDPRPDFKGMIQRYVYLLFKWSHNFSMRNSALLLKFLELFFSQNVEYLSKRKELIPILKNLYEAEQGEIDDTLIKYLKEKISIFFVSDAHDIFYSIEHPESFSIRKRFPDHVASVESRINELCLESADRTSADLFPIEMSDQVKKHIIPRVEFLKSNYIIERIQLFIDNIFVYKLINDADNSSGLYVISFVDCAKVPDKKIERAIAETASIIKGFSGISCYKNNFAEFILTGAEISWPCNDLNAAYIDYSLLKTICISSAQFFNENIFSKAVVTGNFKYPYYSIPVEKSIIFFPKDDSFIFEILTDSDPWNPFYKNEKIINADRKLFDKGKRSVDFWISECLSMDTVTEIKIDNIDTDENPAGSKIYIGSLNGTDACFYMKDSRINGGSTGSREGLKYCAACYYAYLKDIPLYVWNDSAGANINEGVVSLNRGGQGFMMNTLSAERVSYNKFISYTHNCGDPALVRIFADLDDKFSLRNFKFHKPQKFILVAIGIGSSAGLDVYGSSQAVIQILLDSEESYRVLTGSGIIKSVIGENISNYDIGGAKVLGKWAGVVDLIASDKLHLIRMIYLLHGFFSGDKNFNSIRRVSVDNNIKKEIAVFNENIIKRNVDGGFFQPFKEDYYGAESLLAGFSKIGGRRVMIIGPATESGLWSGQAFIKEKEIFKIALRTSTPQIFIFGRKWHSQHDQGEIALQARRDFLSMINRRSSLRFNIVTHPEGLKACEINSGADAVIFIDGEFHNRKDIIKNSTFVVKNFEEAFNLIHRLLNVISPVSLENTSYKIPSPAPEIPQDSTVPFDMIEMVIKRTFDSESFIEFYSEMNDTASGSNLITGLAALNGKSVGIIADQPLVKGGAADAYSTEKFRIFTQFLNRHNIPLVMLSNSSGFMPGSKQERFRIQSIGAESLDENILGSIPVVSVTLKQNYGGRLIHAFNKFLRPGIVYLALKDAQMAVIGPNVAFDLLHGRKYGKMLSDGKISEANEYRENFLKKYIEKSNSQNDARSTGLVDWIIDDISLLRENLVKGFTIAIDKAAVLKDC